jgi:hypothetical protein
MVGTTHRPDMMGRRMAATKGAITGRRAKTARHPRQWSKFVKFVQ